MYAIIVGFIYHSDSHHTRRREEHETTKPIQKKNEPRRTRTASHAQNQGKNIPGQKETPAEISGTREQ